MSWATTFRLDRPLRMYRWLRRARPDFSDEELLFQRYTDPGYQEGDSATAAAQRVSEQVKVRWAEQSLNRGLFSKPVDVLFPSWCNQGVFGYPRRCLPVDDGVEWSVEHAPEWCNFAHTNMFATRGGTRIDRDQSKKVNKVARKRWRESIGNQAQVFFHPRPGQKLAWLRRRFGLTDP